MSTSSIPNKKRKLLESSYNDRPGIRGTNRPEGIGVEEDSEGTLIRGYSSMSSSEDKEADSAALQPMQQCVAGEENGSGDLENDDGTSYLLQWNEGSESSIFRRELQNLFSHGMETEEMPLTDVTLCSGDGELVGAHKIVLSMCSLFFRRLFLKVSKSSSIVVLANMDHRQLQSLLQYIYLGQVHISSEDDLEVFMKNGENLELEGFCNNDKMPIIKKTSPVAQKETETAQRVHHSQPTQQDNRKKEFRRNVPEDDMSLQISDDAESITSSSALTQRRRGRPPSSSLVNNWNEVNMTDEVLAQEWRSDGGYNNSTKAVRYYCCARAKQLTGRKRTSGVSSLSCKAQIKKIIFHRTGKVIYESNGVSHGEHEEIEVPVPLPSLLGVRAPPFIDIQTPGIMKHEFTSEAEFENTTTDEGGHGGAEDNSGIVLDLNSIYFPSTGEGLSNGGISYSDSTTGMICSNRSSEDSPCQSSNRRKDRRKNSSPSRLNQNQFNFNEVETALREKPKSPMAQRDPPIFHVNSGQPENPP